MSLKLLSYIKDFISGIFLTRRSIVSKIQYGDYIPMQDMGHEKTLVIEEHTCLQSNMGSILEKGSFVEDWSFANCISEEQTFANCTLKDGSFMNHMLEEVSFMNYTLEDESFMNYILERKILNKEISGMSENKSFRNHISENITINFVNSMLEDRFFINKICHR